MTVARFAIVAASLVVVGAGPAYSQGTAPRRPASGGLFGATRSDVAGADKLNFAFELASGVESEVPPEVGSRLQRRVETGGGFTSLFTASSDYALNTHRLQLAGNASTAFRYTQSLDRLDPLSHGAGLGLQVQLPWRGSLQIEQSAAYSPSYLYQLFPTALPPSLGTSIPTNPEYHLDRIPSYAYRTNAALSFGLSRSTKLSANGDYNRTNFAERAAARPDYESSGMGANVSHRVSRAGGFDVGYQYRTAAMDLDGWTIEHRPTIGVTYSPALSGTRRLNMRLTVGPAWVQRPLSGPEQVTDDPDPISPRFNQLYADASVTYPFRPNWRAGVSYRRTTEYLAPLSEPVLSDSGSAELSGLITRRVDLSAQAGYASAASYSADGENLDTYTAAIQLRYAVKRFLAVYSEYVFYYYDLRAHARVFPDLPRVFEQHSARVGISLFVQAQ